MSAAANSWGQWRTADWGSGDYNGPSQQATTKQSINSGWGCYGFEYRAERKFGNWSRGWSDSGFWQDAGGLRTDGVTAPPPIVNNNNTVVRDMTGGVYQVEKTSGGAAYNADAVGNVGYAGDFVLRVGNIAFNGAYFFGVNSDPLTDGSYTSIDYSLLNPGGGWQVWESGADLSISFAEATYGWIWRTGTTLYYGSGATLAIAQASPARTVTGVSATLYFDSSLSQMATIIEVYLYEPGAVAISGSASVTLDSFLGASAGQALVEGVGAGTLNAFGAAAAAKVVVKAAASVTPSAFISAAAAQALIEGVGSGALNAFAAAAVGAVRVKAQATAEPGAFTAVAAAKARLNATTAIELGSFASAASAQALVEGAGEGIINPFDATAAAKVPVKAAAAAEPDAFTVQAAIGVPPVIATAAAEIGEFLGAGAAIALIKGISSGTLNAFAAQAAAKARLRAAAQAALDDFAGQGEAKARISAAAAISWGPIQSGGQIDLVMDSSTPARRTGKAGRPQRSGIADGTPRVAKVSRTQQRIGRAA